MSSNMELSMHSSGNEGPPIYEPCKGNNKVEVKKQAKFAPKSENKESMNVKVAPLKVATKLSNNQTVKRKTSQNYVGRKLSLKEMQEKEYPYMDSDVPAIFK